MTICDFKFERTENHNFTTTPTPGYVLLGLFFYSKMEMSMNQYFWVNRLCGQSISTIQSNSTSTEKCINYDTE